MKKPAKKRIKIVTLKNGTIHFYPQYKKTSEIIFRNILLSPFCIVFEFLFLIFGIHFDLIKRCFTFWVYYNNGKIFGKENIFFLTEDSCELFLSQKTFIENSILNKKKNDEIIKQGKEIKKTTYKNL